MSSHFSYYPKNKRPKATAKNLVKVLFAYFSSNSHKTSQILSAISPLEVPTKTSPNDKAAKAANSNLLSEERSIAMGIKSSYKSSLLLPA